MIALRDRIDEISARYPTLSFISFADSLLLKSNWFVGQWDSEIRYTYEPDFTQSGSLKKIGVDHPAALEAIWFFGEQIEARIDSERAANGDRAQRLEWLAEAALRDLKLVAISLDEEDGAQVIFETLNGRGAELNATDLIRNFIFMRADREGADSASLYDTLWTPFVDSFWTESQRRGRLKRPRLEVRANSTASGTC